MNKNIVLIRFSSRDSGNCAAAASRIRNFYSKASVTDFIVDVNTVQPCGNCNYECLTQGKMCPNLNETYLTIMDAVCNAAVVYFIVPNFCGYPSANYFAFNERSVGYFNMDRERMEKYMEVSKRFIIISNSEGDNFKNAMMQQVNEEPDILYLKSSKYKKRSINGDMMDSEVANADLQAFLEQYSF